MNIAMIDLHTYQARKTMEAHIAKALGCAVTKRVKEIAYQVVEGLEFSPKGEYFHDTHVSGGRGDCTYFVRSAETVERTLNAESAFEVTVGKGVGQMVVIAMPPRGERVFVSEWAGIEEKRCANFCRYNGGITAKIEVLAGSWVEIDGDGDERTFRPTGVEAKFSVREMVGETAIV